MKSQNFIVLIQLHGGLEKFPGLEPREVIKNQIPLSQSRMSDYYKVQLHGKK